MRFGRKINISKRIIRLSKCSEVGKCKQSPGAETKVIWLVLKAHALRNKRELLKLECFGRVVRRMDLRQVLLKEFEKRIDTVRDT